MPDYQKMYYKAFNALTNVEKLLKQANTIIWAAQLECEDLYSKEDTETPRDDD